MKYYQVVLYDGFDNEWIAVTGALSKEEADVVYNEKTNNGTEKTNYNAIDYYKIVECREGTKSDMDLLIERLEKEQG